ncbi:uncharacterized protein LY89DRAFT_776864 [Mollisia scopiformis]|uniref:SNF2 N-terminal domain-containing protein n=1 Tax=Mollisia scopiformis TaxID=149040 RepID=A0A194XSC7_MOLSC|nr:uncharacterized protein LY89DRAFT_776864 [Mollisia scopiformis]KUJ23046.1 hypothetical protein LY89DRAFT_776864 [Mollisia scopiformis]
MPPSDTLTAAEFLLMAKSCAHKITVHEREPISTSRFEQGAEEAGIAFDNYIQTGRRSTSAALQPMTVQEKKQFDENRSIFESVANLAPSFTEACKILDITEAVIAAAWLIQKCRTIGGGTLTDGDVVGKKAEILEALVFMNTRRKADGEFGPALPTIVVCAPKSIPNWQNAIQKLLPKYLCHHYTVKEDQQPWTKETLEQNSSSSGDPSYVIYITNYESLLHRHGEGKEDFSGCFSLMIVDDIPNLGAPDSQTWKTVSNIKPRYWVFTPRAPMRNWYEQLPSMLGLLCPDSLWDDMKVDKELNPFDLPPTDPRAVLLATPYAVKKFLHPYIDDTTIRRNMLTRLYGQVMLKRTYGTKANDVSVAKEILTAKPHNFYIDSNPDGKQKMAEILTENTNELIYASEGRTLLVDGRKLRTLVLSTTWLPLVALGDGTVQEYRTDGATLRGFLNDTYNSFGDEVMGFNPKNVDNLTLIRVLFTQSPKLDALCRSYYEAILQKKTLVVWVEYLLEQLFITLVLKFLGANVESIYPDLSDNEKFEMSRKCQDPSLSLHLITTYRATGPGFHFHSKNHISIHLTRSIHELMEVQSASDLLSVSKGDGQFVQIFILNGSWDDHGLRALLETSFSDFYAVDREERENLRVIPKDQW